MGKFNYNKTYGILLTTLIFGCICMLSIIGFFFYNFYNYDISPDLNDWGSFGDFMGGVLNPIISLYSLVLLGFITYLVSRQSTDASYEMNLKFRKMDIYSKFSELRPSVSDFVYSIGRNMNELNLILANITDLSQLKGYHSIASENINESAQMVSRYYRFLKNLDIDHGHLFDYDFRSQEFEKLKGVLSEIDKVCTSISIKYSALAFDPNKGGDYIRTIKEEIGVLQNLMAEYGEMGAKFINDLREEIF